MVDIVCHPLERTAARTPAKAVNRVVNLGDDVDAPRPRVELHGAAPSPGSTQCRRRSFRRSACAFASFAASNPVDPTLSNPGRREGKFAVGRRRCSAHGAPSWRVGVGPPSPAAGRPTRLRRSCRRRARPGATRRSRAEFATRPSCRPLSKRTLTRPPAARLLLVQQRQRTYPGRSRRADDPFFLPQNCSHPSLAA